MNIDIAPRLDRRHQFEVLQHRNEDYTLSFEQTSFRAALGKLLDTHHSDVPSAPSPHLTESERDVWQRACSLGIAEMGMPEHLGGTGTLIDLVLGVEELGRRILRVPFVETLVATRVLATSEQATHHDLLQEALAGNEFIGFDPSPGLGPIPGGSASRWVVRLEGTCVLLLEWDQPATWTSNPAGLAFGNRDAAPLRSTVLASGDQGMVLARAALTDWRILQAATLCEAGATATTLAVEFARTRHTRGVPIGSLQGISHALATSHLRRASLTNLVRRAAWYQDNEPESYPELPAAALVNSLDTSRLCVETAVHVHGGAGVCLESPVTDYFSWVQATSSVAGLRRLLIDVIGRALFDRADRERTSDGLQPL